MLVGKVQNKAIVSDQQGQVVGRLVGLLFNPATEQVTHLLVKTSWKADQLKMIEFDCVELPNRTALCLTIRLNTSQLANQPWLTDFEEAAIQSKKGVDNFLSSRAVIYDPQFQNDGRTERKSTQLFIKRVRFDYSKTPLYLGLPVQALDG